MLVHCDWGIMVGQCGRYHTIPSCPVVLGILLYCGHLLVILDMCMRYTYIHDFFRFCSRLGTYSLALFSGSRLYRLHKGKSTVTYLRATEKVTGLEIRLHVTIYRPTFVLSRK